ncbi:MAG: hypothetical protein Q9159_001358, partial [Coniocarpon cinnabarinum]
EYPIHTTAHRAFLPTSTSCSLSTLDSLFLSPSLAPSLPHLRSRHLAASSRLDHILAQAVSIIHLVADLPIHAATPPQARAGLGTFRRFSPTHTSIPFLAERHLVQPHSHPSPLRTNKHCDRSLSPGSAQQVETTAPDRASADRALSSPPPVLVQCGNSSSWVTHRPDRRPPTHSHRHSLDLSTSSITHLASDIGPPRSADIALHTSRHDSIPPNVHHQPLICLRAGHGTLELAIL